MIKFGFWSDRSISSIGICLGTGKTKDKVVS